MDQVRFCKHCGELLEHQWIHCPWCGSEASQPEQDWTSVLKGSMDRTEVEQNRGNIVLLDNLSGRLDALELELDAFLAGKH